MPHTPAEIARPRFALISSRWNPRITDALHAAALKTLTDAGVSEQKITALRVPGAWEIPVTVARLAEIGDFDAYLALGCVVRGETRHYEHVADECARALMQLSIDYAVPVLNGVLAVETFADAEARAGGTLGNKGSEVAQAALEMVGLLSQLENQIA